MLESQEANSFTIDPTRILIITEGGEDYLYIIHLISLGFFNPALVVKAYDAKGSSRIYEAYKRALSSGDYDLVFIYCDTEMSPYRDYKNNKRKINYLFYKKDVFSDITFFANPVTMQIMILHKADTLIFSNKKADYQSAVKDCYGIINYDASEKQVNFLVSQIDKSNYQEMKKRLQSHYSDDYRLLNRTNFLKLLNYLEDTDTSWVKPLVKETTVLTKL